MRHAFLIIAHDCIDELQHLIKALDNNYNDILFTLINVRHLVQRT